MSIESVRTRPAAFASPAPAARPHDGGPSFRELMRSDGLTPMTGEEAASRIREAWTVLTGSAPSQQTLAILWAQWAHETARGTRMYGHNFGGIKGTGPTGMSLKLRTREGHGSSERTIRDSFRAYPDAASGARDWIGLLRERYPAAIESAQRGDAGGFVRGLRAKGYFTGSAEDYQRAIGALVREAIEAPRAVASPRPVQLGIWEQGVMDAFRRASERRHGGDEQGG